ncbi:MAG: thymidine phosphorylase [Bacteroidetes bacterium]|jgi:pyrimidine-nucleoside phosphorylase|nr:thymidine phosphorylase [Bacteroidota bacterium]
MASPRPVDLIRTKRDGHSISADDLTAFINAYTAGDVPDYQMSAFLMAAFLKGLDVDETAVLTRAMLHSGTVLDLSHTPGTKVDKHSTGGVGDKVSLILAPIVAACGVPVPMISGRGLGHTGGTLDKLESIPDFRTDLSIAAYKQQLDNLGIVLIGQTAEIAPADRKLYALRDVTATVECIPFIAASIMSKKLAEGIDGLVLDVKCGRGAFMSTEADARRLAETLVSIGHEFGKNTVARMTRMDAPLGRAVGNWPEMQESIRCLQGDVDGLDDLMTVTLALAGEMLWLGGAAESPEAGVVQAQEAIDSGAAFDMFAQVVEAQGGDVSVLHDPATRADTAPAGTVSAPASGFVQAIDAFEIGMTAVRMGAGRRVKEDPVDPTAGLVLHKKVGEAVEKDAPLATLYTARTEDIPAFASAIREAYTLTDTAPPTPDMLLGRYTMEGWTN